MHATSWVQSLASVICIPALLGPKPLEPLFLGNMALLCLSLGSVQFSNEMNSDGDVNIATIRTSSVRHQNLAVSKEKEEHGKVTYWSSGHVGYVASDLRNPRSFPCCKRFII